MFGDSSKDVGMPESVFARTGCEPDDRRRRVEVVKGGLRGECVLDVRGQYVF